MKIYELNIAPNPRRVRMFLAEKQQPMQFVQVDLAGGENLSPEMLKKNPSGYLPFLELDDGTVISETIAICRYLESLYPEPRLFGSSALEIAQIEMVQRRIEFEFFMPVLMCFLHTTGHFKDRMTQIPEWGEEAGKLASKAIEKMEDLLQSSAYIAADYFTVADITLLCALDFAKLIKVREDNHYPHLQAWHDKVSARPSALA